MPAPPVTVIVPLVRADWMSAAPVAAIVQVPVPRAVGLAAATTAPAGTLTLAV